jgi:exosortase
MLVVATGFTAFTVWNQAHWWRLKEDYAFGWLVPFFAGYVVHERWPAILAATRPRAAQRPENSFARLLPWSAALGGATLFLLGAWLLAAAGASYPASLALALGNAGVVLGLAWLGAESARGDGAAAARLLVFPACVWLLSAPLVSAVENALSLFLLGKITQAVFFVFGTLGFAIEQQGNVLVLPTGEVGVAEACSGIRSLMGCLFAGAFLGAVCFDRLGKKLALICAAAGFAFLTNLMRSLFLTGWAYRHGPDAIAGRVHDWTGYAVLGLTALGLLALVPVLNWRVRFAAGRA